MTSILTPEQFLAQRDPEDEADTDGFTAPIGDPLESIARSLQRLTEIVVRRDSQEEADDEARQLSDQLDREYAELREQFEVNLGLDRRGAVDLPEVHQQARQQRPGGARDRHGHRQPS